MEIIADFHLHSRYSRAVSQQMTLAEINRWAKIKGLHLMGTGDFTHPLWIRELENNLEESGAGIYRIKDLKGKGGVFFCSRQKFPRFIPKTGRFVKSTILFLLLIFPPPRKSTKNCVMPG